MLIVGAVVYTNIGFAEFAEHTGIYLGADRIVELNGDGNIRIVDSWSFLNSSSQRTGDKIYIACDQFGYPLKKMDIAVRAIKKINEKWDYDLLFENCHEFTAGAITNVFENEYNYFTGINELIRENLNNNTPFKWRHFKINRLSNSDDIWITNFFSAIKMTLTMIRYDSDSKDIKNIFEKSGLKEVIKTAPESQKEILAYYREIIKYQWKKRKEI